MTDTGNKVAARARAARKERGKIARNVLLGGGRRRQRGGLGAARRHAEEALTDRMYALL